MFNLIFPRLPRQSAQKAFCCLFNWEGARQFVSCRGFIGDHTSVTKQNFPLGQVAETRIVRGDDDGFVLLVKALENFDYLGFVGFVKVRRWLVG